MAAAAQVSEELIESLVRRAVAQGASAADAIAVESDQASVRVRMGEVELVQQSRPRGVGLRVFFGQRSAVSSTSDLTPQALSDMVRSACELARVASEDAHAGLPDPEAFSEPVPEVELYDPDVAALTVDEAAVRARAVEAAALAYDPRLTKSEGGEFSYSSSRVTMASSAGFVGSYRVSRCGLAAVPIATEGGGMVRDHWASSRRFLADLESPEVVGAKAGARTIRRLGAVQAPTSKVPVIFEQRVASGLVGHVADALNGYSLYKRASFLYGRLGETIAAPGVTLVDDGTVPRGLGSRPFDGDGLPSRRNVLVDGGRLEGFVLDTYSARKLGLQSSRNASRSLGDAPAAAVTNLVLLPGTDTAEALIGSVSSGVYVVETFGFGVNTTTGDYSQGAVGCWIEGGELSHAVHEFTIAGNLLTMLQQIEGIANDPLPGARVCSPTLLIGSMTVAGR